MKLLQLLLIPILWLLRKLLKLAIILIVALVIVMACGNLWLPWVIRWQIKSRTGFTANVESSRGSLLKGYLDFRNFNISSPKDAFDDRKFVSLNELAADVKLRSLASDTIVLEKIVVDIDSVTLVKNANGTYNYQLFVKNAAKRDDGSPTKDKTSDSAAKSSDKKSAKADKPSKKLHLDSVVFAIKSVKIVDESVGGSPKEYSLNYRREFSNVDDMGTVIKTLISDLSKYGLAMFIQTTLDSILHLPTLEEAANGLIKAKDVTKDMIEDIGGGLKSLFKLEKPDKSSK